MMGATKIDWADESINPIRAKNLADSRVGHYCEKVSSECDQCYASAMQSRFGSGIQYVSDASNREKVELFFTWDPIEELKKRKKSSVVFWCSMTDLFLHDHSDEWIDQCFAAMWSLQWHTHMVLTKRPGRMKGYLIAPDRLHRIAAAAWSYLYRTEPHKAKLVDVRDILADLQAVWPLPNVMLGVSVGTQKAAEQRMELLLNCPARLRFVSAEPLLDQRLDLTEWIYQDTDVTPDADGNPIFKDIGRQVHLIIAGGESGSGARPCYLDGLRGLRDQCQDDKDGPCWFLKQIGSRPIENGNYPWKVSGKGNVVSEWPADLQVRCREWPEVAEAA
jgi:protein gp37